MQVFDNYIAGERVAPVDGKRFASVNPTTGKVWGEFAESSRADVDRLYDFLLGLGASVLDPPADYPAYGDGYYAVFFSDPDGLKLEFVYEPR